MAPGKSFPELFDTERIQVLQRALRDCNTAEERADKPYTWEESSDQVRIICCQQVAQGSTQAFCNLTQAYMNALEDGDKGKTHEISQSIQKWHQKRSDIVMLGLQDLTVHVSALFIWRKLQEDYCDMPIINFGNKILERFIPETSGTLITPMADMCVDQNHVSRRVKLVLARDGQPGNDLIGFVQRGEWDTLARWIKADRKLIACVWPKSKDDRIKSVIKGINNFEQKYFALPKPPQPPPQDSTLQKGVRGLLDFIAPPPSTGNSSTGKKQPASEEKKNN